MINWEISKSLRYDSVVCVITFWDLLHSRTWYSKVRSGWSAVVLVSCIWFHVILWGIGVQVQNTIGASGAQSVKWPTVDWMMGLIPSWDRSFLCGVGTQLMCCNLTCPALCWAILEQLWRRGRWLWKYPVYLCGKPFCMYVFKPLLCIHIIPYSLETYLECCMLLHNSCTLFPECYNKNNDPLWRLNCLKWNIFSEKLGRPTVKLIIN